MADNCALPKMAGRLNFPYQAIAFFEIVSSTLIKKGITATLKTLWRLLISRAGSWYFFTFSTSVIRIFSFPGTAMSISVHSCNYVFMYNSRIWTIVLQLLVHKDSHIPSYPHFSILCKINGKVDGHTTCWYTVIHTSCIAPNVPVEPPFCRPPHILSRQVSTDNMSYYCIGGFTAQSVQQCLRCLIYAVLDQVCSQSILSLIVIVKACYFY